MYKPPVEITVVDKVLADIGEKTDNAIMLEITQQFGVDVDKYELVKALAYDRGQYDKGFADGVNSTKPKHGKWIERESGTEDKENGFETVIVCSRCDFPATMFYSEDCESRTQIRTDFCPNCGADMRGKAE